MIINKLLSRFKSQLLLLGSLLLSTMAFNAHAVLNNVVSGGTDFSCDVLYGSRYNGVFIVDQTTGASTQQFVVTGFDTSTAALGRVGGRNSGNPLRMYLWPWNGTTAIRYVESGSSTDVVDTFPISDFGATYFSGGEINQLTGEIYFSGAENVSLHATNFYYGVYDPATGTVKRSAGGIAPKPGSQNNPLSNGGVVSSDMAIDAEGNLYSLVHVGTQTYLIKVEIGGHNQKWYYEIVAQITGMPVNNVWGMAFLNGTLFAHTSDYYTYSINVLTGVATRLPTATRPALQDLASCQVAPVIRGKVYKDTTGTGNIAGTEDGLSGINVELWKDNQWYKTYTTSSTGAYSFLVDSTRGQDYYIRIKQPKIDGVNAVQTWATSNSSSLNPVAAQCDAGDGTVNSLTSDGACRGASLFAPDPIGNQIEKGYIYSKITMNSDEEVAEASFALTTASNYGDAPSNYNNTTAPARHLAPGAGSSVNNKINWLRLGDKVTTQAEPQSSDDANSIASHDGVKVALQGTTNFVSLQDALLVSGKSYTFQVKTTGPASAKGYLNGWVDWSAGSVSGSFGSTQIAIDVPGVDNDYVTFDYTFDGATGLHPTYARFRFSTTQGLGPNNNNLPTPSDTIPWVVDGEVEDYRLYITTGDVSVSAVSQGGTGKFDYTMTNISSSQPSINTDSITTIMNGVKAGSSSLHAFLSVGQAITITQTAPSDDWEIIDFECKVDSAKIEDVTLAGNVLTIPASAVTEGSSIACTFTNGVTPKIELTKTISGTRFDSADQFTVQIKEGDTVTTSATTSGTATTATTSATKVKDSINYKLTEVMATNSKSLLGRYETMMSCLNSYSDSTTTLPSGTGQSFTLKPAYGDDIKCTLTNTSITANISNSTIKASPPSITANGTTESTITVQLKDSNNSNITVGGDSVEIFFTDAANKKGSINNTTSNSVIATDNNDGTYSVKVTSTKTGSDSLSYKVNNTTAPADKIATVTYTADSANVTKSSIALDKNSIVADDNDLATVTVTLKDGQGNQLPSSKDPVTGNDYVVKLVVDTTSQSQVGILQPADGTMKSNGDGTFTAYVKSTQAGQDILGFTVDSQAGAEQKTITYTVGEPDNGSSIISASKPSITADGVSTSILTVTLKDKYGNQLTTGIDPNTGNSYPVVIVITNDPKVSDAVLTTSDNGDGTFSAAVTSTKTGTDTFNFTLAGILSSASPVQVTYTPGAADLSKSTINASPESITADDVDTSTITVQLKDKFNNNLTTQAGNVIITGVNIATQAAPEITASYFANGQYTVTLSSTKTGVDGTIGFKLGANEGDDTTSVTYLPGLVDLEQSTITLDKDSIVANDTELATITIQLKDSKGNNVTTSGGVATLVFNNNPSIGTVVQALTDNQDGTYTATIKSTVMGSDVIGYTLAGQSGANTRTLNYMPGAVNLTESTIVAQPTAIEANDNDTSTITVQLKDAFGNNLVTNEGTITLSTVNSAIGTYEAELNYQGSGRYTGTVKSKTAGTDTFEYTLTGVGKGTKTADVTYKVGGVSLTKSTINASPTSIVADGNATSIISVQLKDQYENNLTAQDGNLVYLIDLETGYPADKTDVELNYVNNGLYQITIKSTKAGSDNLGFKVGTSESAALNASDRQTVTYTPGAIDYSTSTIVAQPASITANDTARSTITVQLKDKYGNDIKTDQGVITLTDLDIGKPNNGDYSLKFQSNGTYTGTVTSTVVGEDSHIGFTLSGGNAGEKTTSITYTPGSVSLTQSTINASLPSITANYSDTSVITVQFKDAYGNNLDAPLTGTVALTGINVGVGEIQTALTYAGQGAYQAKVYSKVTGTDNIGFTLDGASGGSSGSDKASVKYVPGAVSLAQSTIAVNPERIVANGLTTSTITVQLKDAYGNNLTDAVSEPVAIFISGTTQPKGVLSTTTYSNNGMYTATVTSKVTGSDDFTFSIGGVASDESKTITYTPGVVDAAKSTISASPPSIVADYATTSTITVQLKDEFGNNLTSSIGNAVSINFKDTVNKKGEISPASVNDNQDGTYSITVMSKVTGSDTFIFSVLGVAGTDSADVTYTPGAVSLSESTILSSPKAIIANGTDTSTITVQLKDQFGNNLTSDVGSPVQLTNVSVATEGNATLIYNGGTTGSYSVTLSSTTAGSDPTIGYTLGGAPGTKTTSVTYKSGGASLTQSTITLDKNSITADDIETATVTIQLKDQYGNNTYNDEVVVLTGVNKGQQITFARVTGAVGQWVGTIRSTQAGFDTLSFTVDEVPASDKKVLTYTPGEASLTNSTLNIRPSSIVADDVTESTITVQLVDAYGNNLTTPAAETVTISIDGASAIGQISATTNNLDGTYTATVKSKVTGVDTLVYKLGNNIGTSKKDVTYTAGALSLTQSTINAIPDEIVADGVTTSTLIIQLKDQFGNNLDSNPGAVTLRNLNNGKIHTAVTYQETGRYEGLITSTTSGQDTIGYTIAGYGPGSDTQVVTYKPGTVSLKESTISVSKPTIVANDTDESIVTVQLKDENGNNLTTDEGVVALTHLDFGKLKVAMHYVSNGQYQGTVVSTKAGIDSEIRFTLAGGSDSENSTSISYTPGGVDLSHSVISADKYDIDADGVDFTTITVQLRDENDNNLSIKSGDVYLKGITNGTISDLKLEYFRDGKYTGILTSTKSGSDTITYTLDGIPATGSSSSITVNYSVGDMDIAVSTIDVSKAIIVANGTDESIITVQLKDKYGNHLDSETGTVALTGISKGTVSAVRYAGNGAYVATISSTVTGFDTIGFTFTDSSTSAVSTSTKTKTVTYTAGSIDLSKSSIEVDKSSITADGSETATITVTLRDTNNNLIPSTTNQVRLKDSSSKIGTVVSGTLTNDGIYTFTVTSTTTGTDDFTYQFNTDGSWKEGNGQKSVEYTAGSVDTSKSSIEVDKSSITADGSETATITVTLRDTNNNLIPSTTNQVRLKDSSSKIGTVVSGTLTNDGIYTFTVTSTTTGTDDFTYQFNTDGSWKEGNGQKSVEYTAGSVDTSKSSIEVDKSSITADGSETATITVTLRDTNNNLIPSTTNQVRLKDSSSKIGTVVSGTLTNDGIYTFTVTSTTTGTDDFTYQFNTDGSWKEGNGQKSVEYTAGSVDTSKSSIEVDKPLITSNGSDLATITVTLRDANNNLVTGTNNNVQLVQSGDLFGTISEVLPKTGDGIFKFTVSSVKPGMDSFSYEYNINETGLSSGASSVDITYQTPLDFADKSSIGAIPTSIVADGVEQSIVTVKLYQATDDSIPLSGLNSTQLALVILGGGTPVGTFTPASTFEVNPGEYQFIVTSGTVGSDNWTFTTGSNTSTKSENVTYKAGSVFDQGTSNIVASKANIDADNVDESIITVTLYYGSDNTKPIEKLTSSELKLVKADGTEAFVGTAPVWQGEQSPGVYTFKVTSGTVGSDTFHFKTTAQSTKSAKVAYQAGSVFDQGTSSIAADKANIDADNVDESIITVTLYYGSDNTKPIEKLTSSELKLVKADGTEAFVGTAPVWQGEQSPGVYTFKVTSGTVGSDTFHFKTTAQSTKSAKVAYQAGSVFDQGTSSIAADKANIDADNVDESIITVTLYYGSDNTKPIEKLTSSELTLVKADGTEAFVGTAPVWQGEQSPGVYTFKVTSGTVGSDTFHFKTTAQSTKSAKVAYQAGSVFDQGTSSIAADKANIDADNVDESIITVTLYYGSDNTKPIEKLTSSELTLVKADGTEAFVGTAPVWQGEQSPGVYTFKVTSGTVGSDTFHFKTTAQSTKSAKVAYQAGSVFDQGTSSIAADKANIDADNVDESIITVTLYYGSDNTKPIEKLTSSELKLVKADGTEAFVGTAPVWQGEQSPGVYTFKVTSGTVGSDTFHFKTTAQSTKSAKVAYQAGSVFDQGTSSIAADKANIDADNVDESIITVTLYYGSDNTKPIEKLTSSELKLVKADGTEAFVGTAPVWQGEQSPGVYTFKVTSGTVGSDTFHFKTTAQSTKSAKVAYQAGSVFDQGTSSIAADKANIDADNVDESIITVTLYYGSDNTKPIEKLTSSELKLVKADGTEAFVGTAPVWQGEQSPGVYTFKVTSGTVGSDTFHFKTTAQSTKSAKVAYQAGSVFDQGTSSIAADKANIDADNVDESIITVTLYYGSDNTKPIEKLTSSELKLVKADGTEAFVGTAPVWQGEQSPGVYTFKVTSGTVGSDTFHFKTTAQSTKSAKVAYQAGSVFDQGTSSIAADKANIDADNVDESIITVTLYYGSDNTKPIEKLTSSELKLVKADGTEAFVGTAPVWQGEQSPGVYTFKVTSGTVGSDTFHFKTTAQSTKSAKVAYQAGSVFDQGTSSIAADKANIDADNVDESIITVTLYYGSDNTKPIEKLTSSELTLVKADGTEAFVGTAPVWQGEQSPGVYTFKVTSGTVGSDTFHFKTTAQSTKSAKVAYQAGSVFDQGTSSIAADKANIDADNVDESIITVTLYYGSDNTKPIEKLTSSELKLVKADGTEAFVGTAPVWQGEQSPGVYTFKVTSGTVGSDTFHFKTTAQSTKSAKVAYQAGSVFDQGTSSIAADKANIDADNVDESIITVTLYYGSDNTKPIEKLTSSELTLVKADGTEAFVGTAPVWQGEQSPGVYTFKVTSGTVGSDTFHFKTTAQSTKSAKVAYQAGSVFDQGTSSIAADKANIDADNVDESIITVTLYYGSDNTKPIEKLTSSELTLVKADGTEAFVGTAPVWQGEQSPGVYTFKVTSGTVGSDTFHFKTTAQSTKSAKVAYQAGSVFDQGTSSIAADKANIDADNVDESIITVTLYYGSDNTKPIEKLTSSELTLVKADGTEAFVGTAPVWQGEQSPGVYTFKVTSGTVGSDTFHFKTTAQSTKSAKVAYQAGSVFDQGTSSIAADKANIDADNVDESIITVTLYYGSDNTKPIEKLTSSELTLVKADGTEAFVGTAPVWQGEQSPGVYTFKVTSGTVGSDTFHFKTTAQSTKSAKVAYQAGSVFDQGTSSIAADKANIDADNVDESIITVTLYYGSDNTKPIEKLTSSELKLVKADGTEAFVGTAPVWQGEQSPGVYTFKVTSGTVGSDTFHFKTTAQSTKSAKVAYQAGSVFDQGTSSIAADKANIDADNVDESIITVTLYYGSDNTKPIEKLTSSELTLVKADGTEAFVGTAPVWQGEQSPGVYTFKVTSGTVGSDTFHFKTTAQSTKSAKVAYQAGSVFDQGTSSIAADKANIDADNVDESIITVTLYYGSDNTKPIEKLTSSELTLVKADGTEAFVGTAPVWQGEQSPGVYTFKVTSGTVGSDTFHFKTTAQSTKSAKVAYQAGSVFDQGTSSIAADKANIDADNVDESIITVTLYYGSDNTKPIEKLTSSELKLVKADGTEAFVGTAPVWQGEQSPGVYTFKVTSGTVGSDTFHFKTTAQSTKSAKVAYQAGSVFDQGTSSIAADKANIDADNVDESIITVTLYYGSDNTKPIEKLTSSELKLVKADGTEAFVGTAPVWQGEQSPGVYTFKVTSGTVGSDTFHFKTTAQSTKSAKVAYQAGSVFDQGTSSIAADKANIDADNVDESIITVTLYYGSDNTKPIEKLTSSELTLVKADGSTAFVGTAPVWQGEQSPGVYTFKVTSGTVGSDTFHFKTTAQSTKSVEVKYTAGTVFDTTTSTIAVDLDSIVADGKSESEVTVELFYASDNTKRITGLSSTELLLFVDGKQIGQYIPATTFEPSPGVYKFIVTSNQVGSDAWQFSAGTTTSTDSKTVSYTAGTDFDTTKSTIIADKYTIAADNEEFSTVTVELFYASDNTKHITGLTADDLTLFVDANSSLGDVIPNSVFEVSPGKYQFIITSSKPGSDDWQFKTAKAISAGKATITYEDNADLLVRISTKETNVKIGDVVLFTLTAENRGRSPVTNFSLLETLPAGFSYVANSAALTENPRSSTLKTVGNSPLSLENLSLNSGETLTVKVVLRVGAGVKAGNHTTYLQAYSAGVTRTTETKSISNRASASITVTDSDPLFDESLIVGTVYEDRNGNGIQDDNEPGIPGVKIVSAEGLIITTDQYGRYHLEGILGGKWDRGRNYILKVDPASLPKGTKFVSNNPLVRRITPGLPVRFDFGVQLPKAFVMDVSDNIFVDGKSGIKTAYTNIISQMAEAIKSNNIKELVIVTDINKPLSTQREEALRTLLNAHLDEKQMPVISSINSTQEAN